MTAQAPHGAAFYCVCDARFFPGLVGAINSLRLHGHDQPVYVLDAGLEGWQRDLLSTEASIVPRDIRGAPTMLKAQAPLSNPAKTAVLVDADVIITRPLTGLIERAGSNAIVGFCDDAERFVPEWGDLLGEGTAVQRPYLSAGLLVVGAGPGAELFSGLARHSETVDFGRTWARANDVDYPFVYGDQDLINALLATRLKEIDVEALDKRFFCALPFGGAEVLDARHVRCAYPDGTEPYGLHHILPAKPWLQRLHDGVYSQLLRRVLTGPDIAIRIPHERLPLRMRTGRLATFERARIDARDRLGWAVRRALPDRVITRLDARRRNGISVR